MRMYRLRRAVGVICALKIAGLFKNRAKPRQSAEVLGVQHQHPLQIGKRGPV